MTDDHKHVNRYWGDKPLPTSKAEFFNAVTVPTAGGDGDIATIRLYGPIDNWGGYWGVSANDVSTVLDALPDTVSKIIIRINSGGGSVFEAMSILNMLRAHRAHVTAVVDGLAASAASYIAAGCDETVMSPGTQMMIHSPSIGEWGNAATMRKTADMLDQVEASIIEIYTGKAGDKDWAGLMADETFLTAAATVDLGLADRVAIVPDEGETVTADDGTDVIAIPDDEDPEDNAAARVVRIAARARVANTERPVSTEPGNSIRKESIVQHDAFVAGIRERLGMTDAGATDETVLAALDEALEEAADMPTETSATNAVPDGAIVMDAAMHAQLVNDAAAGRAARDEQIRTRRDQVVSNAIREGRIAPASRDQWRAALDKDEESITKLLATFPANKAVPTDELGRADEIHDADDALYNAMFGDDTKGA